MAHQASVSGMGLVISSVGPSGRHVEFTAFPALRNKCITLINYNYSYHIPKYSCVSTYMRKLCAKVRVVRRITLGIFFHSLAPCPAYIRSSVFQYPVNQISDNCVLLLAEIYASAAQSIQFYCAFYYTELSLYCLLAYISLNLSQEHLKKNFKK